MSGITRTRTRDRRRGAQIIISDYNPQVIIPDTVTPWSTSAKGDGTYESIVDVVTPNYREIMKSGGIVMSPVTRIIDKRFSTPSNLYFGVHPTWGARRITGEVATWAATTFPDPTPTSVNTRISQMKASTLVSAHAKVGQSEAMSLVTVAEAGKTARMISAPLSSARGLVDKMISRKANLIRRGFTAAQAASSAWLEYRLGWKPVLYDLENIQKAYVLGLVDHLKPVRLVARAKEEFQWETTVSNNLAVPGTTYTTLQSRVERRVKVSSGVLYELVDENARASDHRRWGLRLADVPAALWELTPWSFVVDRFYRVGRWLDAIVPKPGVTTLGAWTSRVDHETRDHLVTFSHVNIGGSYIMSSKGGSYHEHTLTYQREVEPPFPTYPPVNPVELSLHQHADHVALIIAQISGMQIPRK